MGTADTSFLRNNNCKVPAVLYSCRVNMVVHQVRRMCQRPKRVNDIFVLTKAWLFLKQMRGSISPKSHTLQLFLLKKLPKVYRIKSSNTYRAKQGYTVTERFLNRKSGIFGFVVSDYYYQTERLLSLVSNKVNKRMIKRVISCYWETSEWSLTTRLAESEIGRASESLSKLESEPIGVIEIWLSKLVIEILSERMLSKFVNKLTEWVIIIRVRDYLIGWATWEAIVWTMEWVNDWSLAKRKVSEWFVNLLGEWMFAWLRDAA